MSHFPPPYNPHYDPGKADPQLVQSILVTLFCCQPLGIVAIVFSAMAMSANNTGDHVNAHRHADTASKFINWSFGLGLAYILFVLLCVCTGALTGNA